MEWTPSPKTGVPVAKLTQGYGTTLPCGSSIKVMPVSNEEGIPATVS